MHLSVYELSVHNVQLIYRKEDVPSGSYAGRHVEDERNPSGFGWRSGCKGADAHELVPAAPDGHLIVVSCGHPWLSAAVIRATDNKGD